MLFAQKTRPATPGRPLAAAALLALFWMVAPTSAQEAPEPAAAPERIRVALLPVVIHSIDDQAFLRSGLSDMLLSRLGREARLAVIPVANEAAATNDLEMARTHARSAGAHFVVYGSMTHFGQGASVDLSCAAVDGDAFGPREVFIHAGSLGEIIPTLDGMADRIARFIIDGPPERAGSEAPDGEDGEAPSAGELQDLVRRVEALERALDPELAVEEEIEVPGIFQVYPEGSESATN